MFFRPEQLRDPILQIHAFFHQLGPLFVHFEISQDCFISGMQMEVGVWVCAIFAVIFIGVWALRFIAEGLTGAISFATLAKGELF
jgi:hypothetical protein